MSGKSSADLWADYQQTQREKIDAIERAHRIVVAGRAALEAMCRAAGIRHFGMDENQMRTALLERR